MKERVAGGGGTPAFAYRVHLDGLRALAVGLVLVFHAGVAELSGGFIGVDVFFVLSGYLVTSVLLTKHVGPGSTGLAVFYARRVRRLLPAAALALAVTFAWFASVASPLEFGDQQGAFAAALAYVSNWWFIGQGLDYFGAELASSPVLHFWSLSVEEQFYALWPLVVLGAARVVVKSRRAVGTVVLWVAVLAGVASVGAALTDPWSLRMYYGTDARAYQLLFGAALAVLLPRLSLPAWARHGAPVGVAAMVVGSMAALVISPVHRGILACLATGAFIVGAESGPSWISAAFGRRVPVWLGRTSYGIYLWHWPATLALGKALDISGWSLAALVAVVAVGLAAVSYYALEMPIRSSRSLSKVPRSVVVGGVGASLLTAAVVLMVPGAAPVDGHLVASPSTTISHGSNSTPTTTSIVDPADDRPAVEDIEPPTSLDAAAAREDWSAPRDCADGEPSGCLDVAGGGQSVLFYGDSHAWAWLPAMRAVAEARGWDLYVQITTRCPWHDDLVFETEQRFIERCADHRDFVAGRLLRAVAPEVVVVAARQVVGRSLVEISTGTVLDPETPQHIAAVAGAARATVSRLLESVDEVWIIEPVKMARPEESIPECLSRGDVDACSFVPEFDQAPEEAVYRGLALEYASVTSIDMDDRVCPGSTMCEAVVDGFITRKDNHHLTASFARHLAPVLNQRMPLPG